MKQTIPARISHEFWSRSRRRTVAQASKPAVSPTSKSAGCAAAQTARGFGNPRYGRLGSLRYARVLAALALAVLLEASRVCASTLTVTNLSDNGPGSLRQAIADAGAGDTITFAVEGTITLTNGPLTISRDLDIEGPGPEKLTVSGNHASRVFVIQSGAVTLAGLWIRDGLADGNSPVAPCMGGGVVNYGTLVLTNDVLSENAALGDKNVTAPVVGWFGSANGGGVASLEKLEVTGCWFIGNLARGADGSRGQSAAGAGGGGALINFGDTHVTGSHFTGNVAQGGSGCSGDWFPGTGAGGAIVDGDKLSVTGSTFSHNRVISGNDNRGTYSGNAFSGAIHVGCAGALASLELRDSQFHHNQAVGGDGNVGGPVFDTGSVSGGAYGGAIHSDNMPATISGCTLDHNEAIGGAGALGLPGSFGFGGGIETEGAGAKITVTNCTVEYNTALGGPGGTGGTGAAGAGGGLRAGGGTLTVINTTVAHNLAQGGESDDGSNGGDGQGGGLQTWQGFLVLTNATVTNNWALGGEPGGQGLGGGVYNGLGTFTSDSTTVSTNNQASTSHDDLYVIPPPLAISRAGGKLTLTFSGTLQAADTATGPWTDISATNSMTLTPSGPRKFYRAKWQ